MQQQQLARSARRSFLLLLPMFAFQGSVVPSSRHPPSTSSALSLTTLRSFTPPPFCPVAFLPLASSRFSALAFNSALTTMNGIFHPSRLLQLQEPDEIEEAPPQPVRRVVTGSNGALLGARQAHLDESPAQQEPALSYSSTPFDDSRTQTTRLHVSYDDLYSHGSMINQRPLPDRPARLFQRLSNSDDPELLGYLARRHVTIGFLHEIDLLLRNNPELYHYSREWADDFNSRRPLDAYKFFLKGYTKPARYVPGYLPDVQLFTLPQCYIPVRLDVTYDEELADFFDGVPYRHDILQEIDRIVDGFCYQIQCGMFVKASDRRLVVYALWGNPIDAYKYYEYNYQTTWLKHRHLPEHIELDKVPKSDNYTLPVASVIGPDEGHRSHQATRMRMARAHDQGIDVLEVLIQDFVCRLAQKGHRRNHIEKMKRKAQDALNEERKAPQGLDIVDMIMGMADSEPRLRRDVVVTYTMTRGGLFTIPSSGMFGNVEVKVEPPTSQSQPKERSAPQTRQMEVSHEKRKNAYRTARTRFKRTTKVELWALHSGCIQEQQQATKDRIAAGRNFANCVLSLNKKTKQLASADTDYLKRLMVSGAEQPSPDDLLARYGNLLL